MTLCEPEDPAHCNLQTWIQIIQILCNFILGLAGKGGISLYILTKFDYFNDLKLFDHYEILNVNVFLASSVALTLISWVGVFAGTKKCATSSLTNGLLLGGFVIGTTTYVATMGIITDYTKTGDLYNQMKTEMEEYAIHSNFIDTLQTTLLCCGLDGVNTWDGSYIPESCCRHPSNLACTIDSPNLQTNGCFEEFVRTGRYYAWLLYSILASSGLLEYHQSCELTGLSAAMLEKDRHLLEKERKEKRRSYAGIDISRDVEKDNHVAF
ncbi:uncharacterized protein [Linepithema humile]|uniref:uncharacterized protein isoform X2 n=1 Tax=Linepithema humile TaxID=83485 RepID=UPI00351EBB04